LNFISINFYYLILTKFTVYAIFCKICFFCRVTSFLTVSYFLGDHRIQFPWSAITVRAATMPWHENVLSIISSHLILLPLTHHLCAVAAR